MSKQSAGILLYRRAESEIEVFLVHPGRPLLVEEGRRRMVDPQGRIRRRGRSDRSG